jgi:hypothetical protein
MAIARTQAVSATSSSATLTSTSANDLIVVMAYRGGSAATPTIGSGYTQFATNSGTGQSYIAGYKVSSGGETTTGTWTNATAVACLVFSGATSVGAGNNTAGNTTTISYPALTLSVGNGTSVVVGFGAAGSATAGLNGTPSGTAPNFTNRTNQTSINGCDTAATASNLTAQTLAFTTTSRWYGVTAEVIATTTATGTKGQFLQFF